MILGYYLDTSPQAFLSVIHTWPSEIYNPDPIIAAVQTKWQSSPQDRNLMESLAELYLITNQPVEVVKYYVRLGKPETFEFIRRFRLFDVLKDDVVRFLELKSPSFEEDRTEGGEEEPNSEGLALLIDHAHTILPEGVLNQLSSSTLLSVLLYSRFKGTRRRISGRLGGFTGTSTRRDLFNCRLNCTQRLIGRNWFTFSRHQIHIIWKKYM